MKPTLRGDNVIAICPSCCVPVTFEWLPQGKPLGLTRDSFKDECDYCIDVEFRLLRCNTCGFGGLASVNITSQPSTLIEFWPKSPNYVKIPIDVPREIRAEFREAEKCMGFEFHRAASAMFRSALERTLKANGYGAPRDSLRIRIDMATADGIITATLQKRAHDEIRSLGNDVLHDDYREISADEVADSHHYIHRILEAFYDHRETVEATLIEKGRLTPDAEESESEK